MPDKHGNADPHDDAAPPLPFAADEETGDDGVAVIAVEGECDLATMPRLRPVLEELSRRDASHLVLDLTHVSFIDSTTLGVLLSAQQRYAALGGGIAVACADQGVRRTL